MGIDIERWLREGLVDMLATSGLFRLNDWQYSIQLGHKYGVLVYPCLSNSWIREEYSGKVRQSVECYRGRAMNAWSSGADGVYLFNFDEQNSPILNEIGEPETLERLDKVYCTAARSLAPAKTWLNKVWARFLNRPWWSPQNPLPLREGEVIIFYLDVGEDISENIAKGLVPNVKLLLLLQNVPGAKELTVVLNDHELVNNSSPTEQITSSSEIKADEWYEYNVDPSIVIKGANRIKLTLWECGAKNPTLADVLLWVRYLK